MSRIIFMGDHSRKLWWDVRWRGGWLVIHAGRGRWRGLGRWRLRLPSVYWSPNGTPWHHGARSVFRAKYVTRQECVCTRCRNAGGPQE